MNQQEQANNKAQTNGDLILHWPEYDALLTKIQFHLEQEHTGTMTADSWQAFLADYGKLLEMRDRGFPLLLREGDAFSFTIRPANIHLLPPLNDRSERWLLATLVQEEEPSGEYSIFT